ncbi:TerB family tellurite resistance protein [bacterium AH-315-P15]|nr:TerB family tellurite resistance protein [bacterium AH-315-P15]
MAGKIFGWLKGAGPAAPPAPDVDFSRKEIAAAALLVESSRLDTHFDDKEKGTIERLVREKFDLSGEDAHKLLEYAAKRQGEVYSDWVFTETVRKEFSLNEREEIIGMLWEVAYADGTLHRFEAHMIHRVADELGVSKEALEKERASAIRRLGVSDPSKD